MLLPPRGQTVEQAQLVLRHLIERHLVLILATLLGEGADALVDPLVAVDLGAALGELLLRLVMAMADPASGLVTVTLTVAVTVTAMVLVGGCMHRAVQIAQGAAATTTATTAASHGHPQSLIVGVRSER